MASHKLTSLVTRTRAASWPLATLPTERKNAVLRDLAAALLASAAAIKSANARDVKAAQKKGLHAALIDRLVLNDKRIQGMSQAVADVAGLPDPVGEIIESRERGGLTIKHVRIPLGVILMIYESRPNVTVDAAALTFKSGNAVILRGGSEAFQSNKALVKIIQDVLKRHDLDPRVVTMIPDTSRQSMVTLLKLDGLIDVVIPRGGESLMQFIKRHAAIPVIKHDKGVCNIFVDETADFDRAVTVIENAKVQRPGVCNALETLYVHEGAAAQFLPKLAETLIRCGVELRGDATVKKIVPSAKRARPDDWGREYLDLILAIKTVKGVDDAISHIRRYGSHHTESILTRDPTNARKFVDALDSSCVMINTSTRFNDGGELGLGAEIGISTTKLHAYGPMGLRELTSAKYVVESDYCVRT
jgi:glutamate-5-semialdehyde dehydrogenase